MKRFKEEKGITLIALIITIIVMIILVGVTINVAMNGGLMEKAGVAAKKQEEAILYEQALTSLVYDVGGLNLAESKTALEGIMPEGTVVTIEQNKLKVEVSGKHGNYTFYFGEKDNKRSEEYSFTLNDLNTALGGNLAGYYEGGGFVNIPSNTFWSVVGTEELKGYYGTNNDDFKLTNIDGSLSCSDSRLNFMTNENQSTLMQNDGYAFAFVDTGGDIVDIYVLEWDADTSTFASTGETMISLFGDAVFKFDGSQKANPMPVLNVEVGKYVWYDYNNNQVKDLNEIWRVLYNNSDGVQIYSVNGLGEYTIGDNSSLSNTITQINGAYDNLNAYCRTNYFNSAYATDIRNITTFNSASKTEDSITVYDEKNNEYTTTGFICNPSILDIVSMDYRVISDTFGADIPSDVFCNSRLIVPYGGSTNSVTLNRIDNNEFIIYNRTTNVITEYHQVIGKVMPVVTLKSTLKIQSGAGTVENPYVLAQ